MSPTKVQPTAAEVCSLIASQARGSCLHDPAHPRVGGTHPHHFNPFTETGRGGSGSTSLPIRRCHPRTLQRLCRCLLRRGLCPPPPPSTFWGRVIELHPDAHLPKRRAVSLSPPPESIIEGSPSQT